MTEPTERGTDRARPDLRSELEARVLALIRAHGIPTPHCNRIIEARGERFEVDFLWSKQRLVVETDGHRFHGSRVAFERDRRRDRNLMLYGYDVVRITRDQIEREPNAVMVAIRRLLDARSTGAGPGLAGSRGQSGFR